MSDQNNELLERLDKYLKNQHFEIRLKGFWYCSLVILFTLSTVYYLYNFNSILGGAGDNDNGDYVALVRMTGVIEDNTDASAKKINYCLNRAFKDEDAKGIILLVNSPGGSPVQSTSIYQNIKRLKAKHNKQLVVVGEDMMTSGAYLASVAADQIYVDPSTVAGSIGVIMSSFAFYNIMPKIGLERRVYTAGEHKDRFSAWKEVTSEDKKKADIMLEKLHRNFINIVKSGRGKRLKGEEAVLFSGDFWTGTEAVELGLADKVGDLYTAMHTEFGVEYYKDYSMQNPFNAMMRSLKTQAEGVLTGPGQQFLY